MISATYEKLYEGFFTDRKKSKKKKENVAYIELSDGLVKCHNSFTGKLMSHQDDRF